MPTRRMPFATAMREHQIKWAKRGNIPLKAFEERHGEPSWVLKTSSEKANLFDPKWWIHIAGKEHRWARSLTSSQCFAVNLFAPLNSHRESPRLFLQRFLPDLAFEHDDEVCLQFEHTPQGAPEWMGEAGQPTQIDVFFTLRRQGRTTGFVLVEVKLTEAKFGSCRGWNGKKKQEKKGKDAKKHTVEWENPRRARCENVSQILASPLAGCWLAETEKRQYWHLLSKKGSTLLVDRIRQEGPCPFRHGLYQLMRSQVLADELCRLHPEAWAKVVVCRHPGNTKVTDLVVPVAGGRNVIAAFRALSRPDSIIEWNPEDICQVISGLEGTPVGWADWMHDRYFPHLQDRSLPAHSADARRRRRLVKELDE